MKKILLIVGLLFAQLSFAAVSEEGIACYKKYDFDCAFKEFKSSAQKGNVESQFLLAIMYSQGRGTIQNSFKAVEWYEKAAGQGLAQAQFALGVMYNDGNGVKQSMPQAKILFGKACDNQNKNGCDAYRMLNEQGH